MWKDVPGWEQLYEVSDTGEVRNKETGRMITGDTNNMGYKRVTFYCGNHKERMFRHRLVAKMFVDNPHGYPEVNHINEDKSDNSADNLEWVTRTMNERANHRNRGKPFTPFVVQFCNGSTKAYEFAPDFATELGVTRRSVHNWLTGRTKGYRKFGIESINYELKA